MNDAAIKRDLQRFPDSTAKAVAYRLGLPEYEVKAALERLRKDEQVVSTHRGDYLVWQLSGHGQTE